MIIFSICLLEIYLYQTISFNLILLKQTPYGIPQKTLQITLETLQLTQKHLLRQFNITPQLS